MVIVRDSRHFPSSLSTFERRVLSLFEPRVFRTALRNPCMRPRLQFSDVVRRHAAMNGPRFMSTSCLDHVALEPLESSGESLIRGEVISCLCERGGRMKGTDNVQQRAIHQLAAWVNKRCPARPLARSLASRHKSRMRSCHDKCPTKKSIARFFYRSTNILQTRFWRLTLNELLILHLHQIKYNLYYNFVVIIYNFTYMCVCVYVYIKSSMQYSQNHRAACTLFTCLNWRSIQRIHMLPCNHPTPAAIVNYRRERFICVLYRGWGNESWRLRMRERLKRKSIR